MRRYVAVLRFGSGGWTRLVHREYRRDETGTNMTRRAVVACAAAILLCLFAACESKHDLTDAHGTPKPADTPENVSEHESGPESPIAYGMKVPNGATQVGPLVRMRSQKLIDAYQPELDAALAAKAAKEAAKAEEEEDDDEGDDKDGEKNGDKDSDKDGEPTPSASPSPNDDPPPATRPGDDSFKLIDDPPKPDTTISLMRVDGDPSDVVYRMITQIATVLPQAGIDTSDLGTYCDVKNHRYTGCRLEVAGTTAGDRPIRIEMTVDPGDLKTRSTTAGNHTKPVMTVMVQYVGDPRQGQLGDDTDGIDDMPDLDAKAPKSEDVWPKMDLDLPANTKLFNKSWVPPASGTILLSGTQPGFVAIAGEKIKDADADARDFARHHAKHKETLTDTVEDLNEISTTYRAVRSGGKRYFATYVLSGRGSYAMLFSLPATDTDGPSDDDDK